MPMSLFVYCLTGGELLHKLLTPTASLFLVPSNNQAGILSAEAERIAHCGVDFRLARGIRHIIQIAFRIGFCQVQGRRKNAFLDGFDAGNGFGQAAGAMRWPVADLVELIGGALSRPPNTVLTASVSPCRRAAWTCRAR